ncbi:unnamed protein product [Dovyalis caffra]|uniref:BZIP domain-containing protein n=1 Tax=Dovyalis caffra TaxID=77055 RepID=A0AAV1R9U7_9ROSI|nr:unnamed protein product [Dovyalis caffra]
MVSENIGYGNAIQESPVLQPQDQDQTLKDTPFSPLDGQSSLLSLTLNEIQLKRGKAFGSMNMDEFISNLWNSDDNQVPSQPNQNVRPANDAGGMNQHPNLARQGSFSIPSPSAKKPSMRYGLRFKMKSHRNTIRTTSEAPAGSSQQKMVTPIQDSNNTCLDMNFAMGHMIGLGYQNVGTNLSAGNGFAAYQLFPQGKGYDVGEAIANNAKNEKCQSMIELEAQSNKKRMSDGPPEVVVERRQRRMIKNRESAARSRARKQAYTVELELELNQLKEENAKLKQIVVMKRKSSKTTPKKADKLKSLRRTVSLAW